jgi:hypothetical protein
MTLEEMKEHMPTRPVELDRLDAFVGTWEGDGEAECAFLEESEQPVRTTGTCTTKWEGDDWYLVSDCVFTMADMEPMKAKETWTYDSKAKVYRSTWVDSMGSIGIGTGKYHQNTNTWKMRGCAYGPHGKVTTQGTVKFIDDDTMEWTYSESMWGMTHMEIKGTSRRR